MTVFALLHGEIYEESEEISYDLRGRRSVKRSARNCESSRGAAQRGNRRIYLVIACCDLSPFQKRVCIEPGQTQT